MTYQRNTTRMASGAAQDDLVNRVRDAMRQLRQGVPVMTEDESQLVSDFARGRNLVTLCKLFGVTERAFREADALSVAEAIRGHIIARRRHRASGVLGVLEAFRREEETNGPANLAQWAFTLGPSRATKDLAVETLLQQEVATRAAIDVLHATDIDVGARLFARAD